MAERRSTTYTPETQGEAPPTSPAGPYGRTPQGRASQPPPPCQAEESLRPGVDCRHITFDSPKATYGFLRDMLRRHEGRSRRPYIPPAGKSSATISTGLDLGQHTTASLRRMGLPEDVVLLLAPLTGKDARTARPIVEGRTIELSPAQDAAVEEAVIRHYLRSTAAAFDKARDSHDKARRELRQDDRNDGGVQNPRGHSMEARHSEDPLRDAQDREQSALRPLTGHTPSLPFASLPKELQAPVVSVLFQHGSPGAVPRFWRYATTGDWPGAIAEMRAFYARPTVLQRRRDLEADIMEVGVKRLMRATQASSACAQGQSTTGTILPQGASSASSSTLSL